MTPRPSAMQALLFRSIPRHERDYTQADMLELFAERWRRGRLSAHLWLWIHTVRIAVGLRLEGLRLAGLLTDVRMAGRSMRRNPGVTATITLTLGLGIGSASGVFSLIAASYFAASPMTKPEELVLVGESFGSRVVSVSYPNFLDWTRDARTIASAAIYQVDAATLRLPDRGVRLKTYRVSRDFMSTLGVLPALGRSFNAADHQPGATRVVVLSHRAWTTVFNADPTIIDRTVVLDDEPATVIGVMKPGFEYYRIADAWLPLEPLVPGSELEVRNARAGLSAVARLAPTQTVATAANELRDIGRRLSTDYPDANTNLTITVTDLRTAMVGPAGPQLWMLLAAVGGLLLIGVLNAANMMAARISARTAEFALRSSLGARRVHLVRQVLIEGVVLGLVAGVVGLASAAGLLGAARALDPGDVPGLATAALDVRVVGFGLGLSLIIGIVFGLTPLFQTRTLSVARLAGSGRGVASAPPRAAGWMVGVQVALTLTLVAGSALMLEQVVRLVRSDLGFEPSGVTRISVQFNTSGTREEGRARTREFYRQAITRLESLATVDSAAVANPLPASGYDRQMGFVIEGHAYTQPKDLISIDTAAVSTHYFSTMGIPVLRGETFDDRHQGASINALVVDETFAEKWFPNSEAVGKEVRLGGTGPENPRATIIGVVGRVRQYGPGAPARPQVYVAQAQWPLGGDLIVRTKGAGPSANEIRAVVTEAESSAVVWSITSLDDFTRAALASPRFSTVVISVFAALALALASLGVYGMVAYDVTRRRTEIGVRMALGATGVEVMRVIMRRALIPVAIGGVAGIAGAFLTSRALLSVVSEAAASGPGAYLVAVGVVLAAGLLATLLPARRAARFDPIATIRQS